MRCAFPGGGGSPRRFRLSLVLAACRVLLCGASRAQRAGGERTAKTSRPILNAAPDAIDKGGNHEGAWVECRHRHAELASDALGPIIAHGLPEAPGYRGGLLSPEQARARLHLDVAGGNARVVWRNIALPALVAPSPQAYTKGYTAVPAQSPPCESAAGACCGTAPDAWCEDEEMLPARGGSAFGPRDHLRSAYRNVAIYSPGNDYPKYQAGTGDRGYTFRCARDAESDGVQ